MFRRRKQTPVHAQRDPKQKGEEEEKEKEEEEEEEEKKEEKEEKEEEETSVGSRGILEGAWPPHCRSSRRAGRTLQHSTRGHTRRRASAGRRVRPPCTAAAHVTRHTSQVPLPATTPGDSRSEVRVHTHTLRDRA